MLGRNPLKHGTQTLATVERVVVTSTDDGSAQTGHRDDHQRCYLAFRYTDEQGREVLREAKLMVGKHAIPGPGAVVHLGYRGNSVRFDENTMQAPDPSVPRGWGAGIYEVEDLGLHHARSLFKRKGVDEQRELFRTGTRLEATVVAAEPSKWLRRNLRRYAITVAAEGRQWTREVWTPEVCVPDPGATILIGVRGDEVALDSDARFDGPPGQALVWRGVTPPAPTPLPLPTSTGWHGILSVQHLGPNRYASGPGQLTSYAAACLA